MKAHNRLIPMIGGLSLFFTTILYAQSIIGKTVLYGIDVSHYQTHPSGPNDPLVPIRWVDVKGATPTRVFVFVKSSEAINVPDQDFRYNIDGAHSAQLATGPYHLGRPDLNKGVDKAKQEANSFISIAGDYLAATYIRPALDIETDKAGAYADLPAWIDAWMTEVKAAIKTKTGQDIEPILYISRDVANSLPSSMTKYPLWISDKHANEADVGNILPWAPADWSFHQYWFGEAGGTCPGVTGACDEDVFNGDLSDLDTLVIPSQQPLNLNFITKSNGVAVTNAMTTIDHIPSGKSDQYGKREIPSWFSGDHLVEAILGKLHFSGLINFVGGSANVPSTKATKLLRTSGSNTSNGYSVEMDSDETCTGKSPVNTFSLGDTIEIYGTGTGLRARYPDPCSDAYAVMPDLSVGTIVGPWQCCNGYIRWKIRYNGLPGIDVWSAEAEPSTGQIFLRKKQNSTCSYSIAPARVDLDTAGAAASSFIINTGSSCYWNAVANSNWITITSNASGYGSNQITFSVAANTGSGSRVGQISVADQTFTVTQAGANSSPSGGGTLALGLNETFVAKDATSGSMAVYNKGGGTIYWSASTTTSWLTVTTPTGIATVNGGTLSFTCQPNTAGSQRVGTIVVSAPGAAGSPQTLTVTQGGSDTANITISNLAVPAIVSAGSNVSVTWSQNSPFAQSNVVFLLTLYPNGQAPEPRALTKYLPVTVPAGGSSFNTSYDLPSDLYSGPYDVEVSLWSDANHDSVYDSGDILLGTLRKAAAMYVNGVPPKPAPVTISGLSVPQSASAGDNVSVTWTDNSPYSQPNVLFRLTLYPAGQTNFRFDLTVPYLAITIPGGGSSFNTTFQLPSNLYSGIYDAEVSLWSDQDGDRVIGSSDVLLGSFKKSSVITVNGPAAPHPKLALSSNNVGVGADAGATSLSVSNLGLGRLDWSASTTANWLSVELSSGSVDPSANGTLSFLFQENSSLENRSATITVAAPGADASPQTITVVQQGKLPLTPALASQPSSASVAVGGNVTFSVAAAGAGTLSYQWKINGIPISGANNSSLALSNVSAAYAGNYTVTVGNANGSVTSQPALLTILQSSFPSWQPAYFTTAEIADPTISGPDADPNHDGISNWMSFAFGLNPKGANPPGSLPASSIVSQAGSQYLTFSYRHLIGLTSIPYKVCVSDDLVIWDETESQIEAVGNPIPNGDGLTELVTVRLKTPLSNSAPLRKFLRLKVGSSQTSVTLFEDNFDDNSLDAAKWKIAQNGTTRVAEEGGMMKVETTQTDRPGTLQTQPVTVPMDRPWTLTRRVMLHRETPYSYQGGNKFFTGYMRFVIDQMQPFGVWYCDYDYAGDSPGSLPKHGFVLAKNGAGGTTNPNTGNVTTEITPLLLDEWFDEKVSYDPISGLLRYFVNGVLRSEFVIGTPPDASPRTMQIEFQAYGWWTTHWQHFDNVLLKTGE